MLSSPRINVVSSLLYTVIVNSDGEPIAELFSSSYLLCLCGTGILEILTRCSLATICLMLLYNAQIFYFSEMR